MVRFGTSVTEQEQPVEPRLIDVVETTSIVHERTSPQPRFDPTPVDGKHTTRSFSTSKTDPQVERVVDVLFDRMRSVLGEERRGTPQPPDTYALVESKAEISALIRSEMPKVLKHELTSLVRTEVVTTIKAEVAECIRAEFDGLRDDLSKHLERLHAIETRLAKIEGAVEKEVQINFPEGAVRVEVPITIPEREVKIAAPINVQPPSVNFDEGAITVHFSKTENVKKEVHFDRDPHDQSIRTASIIDVKPTTTAGE